MENDEPYAQVNFYMTLQGDNFIQFTPMKVIDKDKSFGGPSAGASFHLYSGTFEMTAYGGPDRERRYSISWEGLARLLATYGKKIA